MKLWVLFDDHDWQGIAKSSSLRHLSVEHSVVGDDLVEGIFYFIYFFMVTVNSVFIFWVSETLIKTTWFCICKVAYTCTNCGVKQPNLACLPNMGIFWQWIRIRVCINISTLFSNLGPHQPTGTSVCAALVKSTINMSSENVLEDPKVNLRWVYPWNMILSFW